MSTFAKIERLQYRTIRIAMGYRISTPINVMLFEAKEVPLRFRFNYLTHKFLVKCFAKQFNPVISRLDSLRLTLLSTGLIVYACFAPSLYLNSLFRYKAFVPLFILLLFYLHSFLF